MTQDNIVYPELPENIVKEFSLGDGGKGFVSRRGIARLCGIQLSTVQNLLASLKADRKSRPETLESIIGFEVEADRQIPDLVAAVIIKHYAYSGKPIARKTDMALGAIGLRTVIQKVLNYKPIEKRSLSREEIIELCVLPVPSDWQRRFPEEFYDNLSRLTGLTQTGTSRPAIWAKHTKELVYDWLPSGVYKEVKRCKAETDNYEKLHQFLSEDGLKVLESHQRQLLTLMTAASSISQLKTLLNQSCTGNYQLVLLSK